jgi:hypothetical protein
VAVAGSDLWSARSATGRPGSPVQPLRSAPVPAIFKSGIVASAKSAGASTDDLSEVAAAQDGGGQAGLVLGHSPAGDVISLFTPFNFTSFGTPHRLLRGQAIAAYATIRAASDGSTGHVYVSGRAAPACATGRARPGRRLDDRRAARRGGEGRLRLFHVRDRSALCVPSGAARLQAEIGQEDLQADIASPTAG